jgi:hypothetical protein
MMRIRGLAVLLLVAATPVVSVSQQQGTVQGSVVDAVTLQSLAGAQVSIPGTNLGTLTNQQGNYQIVNVPPGPRTIRVNLIGYGTQEQSVTVGVGGTATADFSMQQTAVTLEGDRGDGAWHRAGGADSGCGGADGNGRGPSPDRAEPGELVFWADLRV